MRPVYETLAALGLSFAMVGVGVGVLVSILPDQTPAQACVAQSSSACVTHGLQQFGSHYSDIDRQHMRNQVRWINKLAKKGKL